MIFQRTLSPETAYMVAQMTKGVGGAVAEKVQSIQYEFSLRLSPSSLSSMA
jgi:hypothetical protein